MNKYILRFSILLALLMLLALQVSSSLEQAYQIPLKQRQLNNKKSSPPPDLNPDFGKIPLYFIPNEGQVDSKALFYAKTSSYTLWLTKGGLIFDSNRRIKQESNKSHPVKIKNPEDLVLERDVSRLVFLNANNSPAVIPLENTDHKVNYFRGNDKAKWHTDIRTSRAVLYRELYPHIDLKVYGVEQQIEYDFVVKPGGEVSDINFAYIGVKKTNIDEVGNLVVQTEFGQLAHAKPVSYQLIEGEKVGVNAEFKKMENNTFGFRCAEYNQNYDLIIDPVVLVYSSYLGGSNSDSSRGIAVDSEGAAYVTGDTYSSDFPSQNPYQETNSGYSDAFITKINSSGNALVYSTYLGGSGDDSGYGIAVDSIGAAYVTGETRSLDFPTQNPIQEGFGGGYSDAFITKISSSGSVLVYSTYLGGSGQESAVCIAVDSEGAAYVAGYTYSDKFPTRNPIQGTRADSNDVFITKISSSGSVLVYSTYLGGSSFDGGRGIAVDSEGEVYVTGYTESSDFPSQNPYQETSPGHSDAFIAKLNSTGSALVYSTYLGGSSSDKGYDIAVDSEGAAYVTGNTDSSDFPTQNPIQGNHGSGDRDTFITKLNSTGSALVYSTYLGGSGDDKGNGIAVDSIGTAYVTGETQSSGFPTKNPIQVSLPEKVMDSSQNSVVHRKKSGSFPGISSIIQV